MSNTLTKETRPTRLERRIAGLKVMRMRGCNRLLTKGLGVAVDLWDLNGLEPAWSGAPFRWHGYIPHGWKIALEVAEARVVEPGRRGLALRLFSAEPVDSARNPASIPVGFFIGVVFPAADAVWVDRAPGVAGHESGAGETQKPAAPCAESPLAGATAPGGRHALPAAAGSLPSALADLPGQPDRAGGQRPGVGREAPAAASAASSRCLTIRLGRLWVSMGWGAGRGD